MPKTQGEFTSVLINHRIITPIQLEGARQIRRQTGDRLEDVLVQFGYATREQVLAACAEVSGSEFLDLSQMAIPLEIIELVPESVARENVLIPVWAMDGTLTVAIADLDDVQTIEKLAFILNKQVLPVLALRRSVRVVRNAALALASLRARGFWAVSPASFASSRSWAGVNSR